LPKEMPVLEVKDLALKSLTIQMPGRGK